MATTNTMLELIVLRDLFAWKRDETTATADQLMSLNGLTAENLVKQAIALLG
jgi:hypothetical protein